MVALAPDNKVYRLEEVYANDNLGTVLNDERRYREMAASFQSSLGVAESLAAAEPRNVDYQKTVINVLGWLADAHESLGALDQSRAERERQLQVIGNLERFDAHDTEIQRFKMTAHRSIGRLLASEGYVPEALKELQASVAISDQLFTIEPENTQWLQMNAAGRFDLADAQLGARQIEAAATTARADCDIIDRLVSRDATVADWKSMLRSSCLELRARIALAQGDAQQALSLSRQWLAAARTSPSAIERAALSFRAMAAAGDALAAAGRNDEAARWWAEALKSVPRSTELRPSEQATLAALELRAGDRAGAEQLISSLAAIGYRHPIYLAAIKNDGASA
jgi:tetratricopeptide (TPR) repeat protein